MSAVLGAALEREHAQVVIEDPLLVVVCAEPCVVGEESVVAPIERNRGRLLVSGGAKVVGPGFGEQGACRPLNPVSTVLVHAPPERGDAFVALGGLLVHERQLG